MQAIRGMKDLLPFDSYNRISLENKLKEVLYSYDIKEMRTPILEYSSLFKHGVGESTDIVNKELYSFEDKNGNEISLRPEGTAGVMRSVLENKLITSDEKLKIFYLGPMFRYERPQKGRNRQFDQLGVEYLGNNKSIFSEVEILTIIEQLWFNLGLTYDITLEINDIGSVQTRNKFAQELKNYLIKYKNDLDSDSQKRLNKNPLRIFDSKISKTQEILINAPKISEFLNIEEQENFFLIQDLLAKVGIKYQLNEKLVRGLDYYNNFVFEWKISNFAAQDTVCAGGRYDRLSKHLGFNNLIPAVGFALGIDRLQLLCEKKQIYQDNQFIDIYFICLSREAINIALRTRRLLHRVDIKLKIIVDYSLVNINKQFKKANKSYAKFSVIIGEGEVNNGSFLIKNMNSREQQKLKNIKQLIDFFIK